MYPERRNAGFSLLEVVVFIVVVGIAVAGLAVLYNQVSRTSVDPLIRKQALQLAASMLEEIELQPYTICDPDDPNVHTGVGCATLEGIGTEGGETRYAAPRFDNVSDYANFSMGSGVAPPNNAIQTVDATTITALSDYRVAVVIAAIAAGELGGTIPDTAALRITVTATHVPTGIAVQLQGYRVRYAPTSP